MSDPQPPRRGIDAIALTLGAIGALMAFSLFGRTGAERFTPPTNDAWTTAPDWLGYWLFESLGGVAYGLLLVWFALAAYRFRRPPSLRYARRLMGSAVLILGAAVIADQVHIDGPPVGGGGSIGAGASLWLGRNLTAATEMIVLAVGISAGMILACDPVVRQLWRLVVSFMRGLMRGIELSLLMLAAFFEFAANCLRAVARRIGNRQPIALPVHVPNDSPLPPETAQPAAANANPNILIHHHQLPKADRTERRLSTATSTPPKISPAPSEEAAAEAPRPYDLPSLSLLDEPVIEKVERHEQKLLDVAGQLEKACADFGLTVKVVGIHTGPVITQYEISLEVGLRVSKITSLSDDLALHLKVPSVRIVAPIPGRNTVGIELPNEHRANVRLKELVAAFPAKVAKMRLPLFFGKDNEGRPLIHDLADMPHLLIAGRTGTGKSVCLNSIILSLLLTRRPDECKLIMIDPKQVELAEYGRLPHLMHPVVTDNKKAEAILSWGVDKMEERYDILRRARVRNIGSYNELSHDEILRRVRPVDDDERQRVPAKMPYIVIVVDEVGDLMMTMKKEVEGHIIRLAQKSRAAGIHLILTTQRPTVDVITGLIKSNLPARICFQVADRSNSRVVLDEMGAEKLLGKGDMLFLQPNTSTIVRAQGTYASDDEILRIVSKLEVENPVFDSELMQLHDQAHVGRSGMMDAIRKRDELYEEAIEIVVREGRGSVSLLQRALGIGYGRAARLIDFMAEDGIVGHYNSGQAREVLFNTEQWDQLKRGGGESPLAESA